ncbi:MAG: hypothetical protein KAT43_04730 [Nanoarchaeota archaeon]|nr:hypothetical protein [Nanoarchaeota archaeon]
MTDIIYLPTKPRNEEERRLLEEIESDSGLKNPTLRERVLNHINGTYALVSWYHFNAIIKPSFEEKEASIRTRNSYNGEQIMPKIVGVKTDKDF